ncbi:S1C family serine protease [Cyanobium sp. NS01]|uniref:S1C family serine protease n=1 Tax=Cyanobium sp. NS01 TaxID=261284 RepID=UPI001647F6C2|nr:serine protease [Cyanobium sp. NS01]
MASTIPAPAAAPCTNQSYAPEALFSQAKPGVAVVKTPGSLGSGFVVRHQGGNTLLLTNAHVVGRSETATIHWADGSQDVAAVLASAGGSSPLNDLALLEVRGQRGRVLPLKRSGVNVGSDIVAIGAPQGLDFSLSRGVVSSVREQGQLLQIDAAINPGNSGGPVLDRTGCVVGMATFKVPDSEGLNFAITSSLLEEFLGNPPQPRSTEAPPIANRAAPAPEPTAEASCWFQMERGATELSPGLCRVERRINANGHEVFDVMERGGPTRSVVMWDDDSAEVFLDGRRYVGRWAIDADGDVRVNVAGGVFAFRRG